MADTTTTTQAAGVSAAPPSAPAGMTDAPQSNAAVATPQTQSQPNQAQPQTTQTSDIDKLRSSYDKRYADLERRLAETQKQADEARAFREQYEAAQRQAELDAINNADPETQAQYFREQFEAVQRAQMEQQQQAQTATQRRSQAMQMFKNAGLDPADPKNQSLIENALGKGGFFELHNLIASEKDKQIAALQKQIAAVAQDAKIEALQAAGVTRSGTASGGNVGSLSGEYKKAWSDARKNPDYDWGVLTKLESQLRQAGIDPAKVR